VQLPVKQAKNAHVATNQRDGQMTYYVDTAEDVTTSVPKMIEVGDCPEPEDGDTPTMGLEVKLEAEPESELVSGVVDLIPEELRHIRVCL
jgi:catalase